MRLLFVVQRYGEDVAGGAERACREYASRLAARGHEVSVATSRARSYVDWANEYPEGVSELDGVSVRRFSVARPRDADNFAHLNARVLTAPYTVAPLLQREWLRFQGPELPALAPWLRSSAHEFDAVICFTYLYWPTWATLDALAGSVPTLLHPLAHDEPALALPLFGDELFHRPDALVFLTEEEQQLVVERFATEQPSMVAGVGVDLDVATDAAAFRERYGLGDRPYLVFVGRLDPGKGSDEVFDFFVAYKQRNPGPLALVIVGEPVKPMPHHPDVITTGFVDEATKASAIAGALALVQPSYFESFSIVLVEAWAQRKPALVQGHCAVLEGQARRSDGAIPYRGYAEFEAALDLLTEDRGLASRLGEQGRHYVEERYTWDAVLSGYESFLDDIIGAHAPEDTLR
ncbi:MAG: glycosyltransferase family 4 protein [Acidimicrobiia bacterium]|nr:glycosyltransferase family 4 protein [Acidimicrobiia bacterium]